MLTDGLRKQVQDRVFEAAMDHLTTEYARYRRAAETAKK